MTLPLLETKLNIPPLREKRVARPHLIDRLNSGLARKLTLVSSPAGFGKTTLLSEFASICDRPVAWFSIEGEDNDLVRFFSYLIDSLQRVNPGYGESVYPALQSPKPERTESLLTLLINEVNADFSPFILVLDDYQLIESQAIHEALDFILDHQPEQMHIMIATRADPPLPLSRLRARDQLTEIRQDDLRFIGAEADTFLNQVMGLGLGDHDVEVMERRTEGWAAGLQLAALSLREQPDKNQFIKTFAGSDRYILDYLGQEVLDKQNEQTRSYLLQTSILDRLSAALCEEITGISNSQEILEQLERDHLFIIPLDQERRWYRYHGLFKDYLRKVLRQTQPAMIYVLHNKASGWFESQGLMDEAIEHSLTAEDYQRAMDLIEEIAEPRLMRSQVSSILRWIDMIPESELLSRPSLCLTQAWSLMLQGGPIDDVEPLLNVVETGETEDRLLGSAYALRAFLASIKGDAATSMELSLRALELLPEDNLFMRSLVADNLGMVYLLSGDFNAAIDSFAQAAEIGQQAGNTMIAVGALCNMAGLWMIQGQLQRAWQANQQALDLATDSHGRRLPVAGKALLGLGEIAREWHDLEAATEYLNQGIELFKLFGELGSVLSYVTLARIKEVQGDLEGAQEIVDLARQLAIKYQASTMDDELVDAYQVQLWIAGGHTGMAKRWAEDNHLATLVHIEVDEARFDPIWEIRSQTLARLYLIEGNYDGALKVIEPMLQVVRAQGRIRSVLKALAFQALILHELGKVQEALQSLEKALLLAQEECFVSVFLDEGEPMVRLLNEAASHGVVPEYVGQLLASYTSPTRSSKPSRVIGQDQADLVEPLSDREVEVLELIAEGLSNQEIAVQLHISLSTVKGHTTSIYGKLGVHKRTQAVATAQTLGILPGS